MADLISRAALLNEFRSLCGPQTGDGWDNMGVHNLIMRQKSVDAVPVVRCSECKYRLDSIQCRLYYEGMITPDNWYCADGERRGGDA